MKSVAFFRLIPVHREVTGQHQDGRGDQIWSPRLHLPQNDHDWENSAEKYAFPKGCIDKKNTLKSRHRNNSRLLSFEIL